MEHSDKDLLSVLEKPRLYSWGSELKENWDLIFDSLIESDKVSGKLKEKIHKIIDQVM